MTDEVVAPGPAVIEQNTSGVVGVLAEALDIHRYNIGGSCNGCDWVATDESASGFRDQHTDHQASVVAALPNIAIVPKSDIVRIYRAASTLGQQYMMPTHFGADLEEAERWFGLQQKMLDGLPGVDTVRLEYQDMWVTTWEPLA